MTSIGVVSVVAVLAIIGGIFQLSNPSEYTTPYLQSFCAKMYNRHPSGSSPILSGQDAAASHNMVAKESPKIFVMELHRCNPNNTFITNVSFVDLIAQAIGDTLQKGDSERSRVFVDALSDSQAQAHILWGSSLAVLYSDIVHQRLQVRFLNVAKEIQGHFDQRVNEVMESLKRTASCQEAEISYGEVRRPGSTRYQEGGINPTPTKADHPPDRIATADPIWLGQVPLQEPDIVSEEEKEALTKNDQTKILRALCQHGAINAWELLDSQDTLFWEFLKNMEAVQTAGLVEVISGDVQGNKTGALFKLSPAGMEASKCNVTDVFPPQCSSVVYPNETTICNSTHACSDAHWAHLEEGFGSVNEMRNCALEFSWLTEMFNFIATHQARPADILQWDQGRIVTHDVIRRVDFIHKHYDLQNAKVIIFGDDDLFGIAVALTKLPAEVVVLEGDKRIVTYINEVAKRLQLKLEARVYDFRFGLPYDLRRRFDVFSTDSVESVPGLSTTLSRASEALKGPGSSGYFGITTKEASRMAWRSLQQSLFRMGFVIHEIRDRFSVYEECTGEDEYEQVKSVFGDIESARFCSHDFYRSALYRVEAVRTPRPLFTGDSRLSIQEFVQTGAGTLIWENNYFNEADPSFPQNKEATKRASEVIQILEESSKYQQPPPRLSEKSNLIGLKLHCRKIVANKSDTCQEASPSHYCSSTSRTKYFREASDTTFALSQFGAYHVCHSEKEFRSIRDVICPTQPNLVSREACLRSLVSTEDAFCKGTLECENDTDCPKYFPCIDHCLRCRAAGVCYQSLVNRLEGKMSKYDYGLAYPGDECWDALYDIQVPARTDINGPGSNGEWDRASIKSYILERLPELRPGIDMAAVQDTLSKVDERTKA